MWTPTEVGNKFWFWTSGSSSDTAWYWEPSGRSMDYSDWLIKREPTPKANSKMVIAFGTQYMNTVYQRWLSTADFFADLGTYLMTYVYYPRYALCRREMNATDVEVSIQVSFGLVFSRGIDDKCANRSVGYFHHVGSVGLGLLDLG